MNYIGGFHFVFSSEAYCCVRLDNAGSSTSFMEEKFIRLRMGAVTHLARFELDQLHRFLFYCSIEENNLYILFAPSSSPALSISYGWIVSGRGKLVKIGNCLLVSSF